MPISLLIVGLNILINQQFFGKIFSAAFARYSFYLGSFLMIIFSITTFLVHLSHREIPGSLLNFAYFMPPVGNIIVPILGNEIINRSVVDGNEKKHNNLHKFDYVWNRIYAIFKLFADYQRKVYFTRTY